ncbi:MAG: hypothetical protein WCD12_20630 [Candidatus Binatus sp.]
MTHAGVITAAMLVAVALLDCIHERFSHRGARFILNLAVLSVFMLSVAYALGGRSAVIEILTH